MGLLDQVLGQVIGQMGSQGAGRGQAAPGGLGGGGMGGGGMGGGGIGGQLGQVMNGTGGKIALAVLALLASKHMQSGAGGYGSVLHDMLGGGGAHSGGADGGGASPPAAGGGGFLNEIGGMLGGGSPAPSSTGGGSTGGGMGGLGGLLGGALGGGALAGGLGDLLQKFQQNGGGDMMNSWIGSGANHPVDPGQLEQHLGTDTVDDLSRQTGMDRGDLLGQLSQALPQIVDKLTPHGRLPTEDEGSRWV